MYGVTFDLQTEELIRYYGENYKEAYKEINKVLADLGFTWQQGSFYVSEPRSDGFNLIIMMQQTLYHIEWFRKSVRDIRAFEIHNWSDLTGFFEEKE